MPITTDGVKDFESRTHTEPWRGWPIRRAEKA